MAFAPPREANRSNLRTRDARQRPGRIRRHELHRVAVRVGDPSVDRREHAYRRLHHRNRFGPSDRAQQPPECKCDDQERGRDRRGAFSSSSVVLSRSSRPIAATGPARLDRASPRPLATDRERSVDRLSGSVRGGQPSSSPNRSRSRAFARCRCTPTADVVEPMMSATSAAV